MTAPIDLKGKKELDLLTQLAGKKNQPDLSKEAAIAPVSNLYRAIKANIEKQPKDKCSYSRGDSWQRVNYEKDCWARLAPEPVNNDQQLNDETSTSTFKPAFKK